MHQSTSPRRSWLLALALGAALLVGIAAGGRTVLLQLVGHAPPPTSPTPLHAPSMPGLVSPGAAQAPHATAPGTPLHGLPATGLVPPGAAQAPHATAPGAASSRVAVGVAAPPVAAVTGSGPAVVADRAAGLRPVVAAGPPAHAPLSVGGAVVIQRVVTTRPYVAITLDDFYTANYQWLTAIHQLQAANALHAPLTLGPAGSGLVAYANKAPAQAQAIKQLVAAGSYEFFDHTYAHPVMPKLTMAAQTQEMLKGAAAIRAFFGRTPIPVFRPPFGSWDGSTRWAAAAAGFPRIVTWSVDTGDSVGPERPAAWLVANAARARAGDIILLHANRQSSAVALPLMIKMLRAKGLKPVLLSTLLASGTPVSALRPPAQRPLATPATPPSPTLPRRTRP